MTYLKQEIAASDFKKNFLRLVDEVKNKHFSFIITKRKIPIAQIVPLNNDRSTQKSFFGAMKGSIKINEDIVNFNTSEDWEVNHE